MFFQLMLNEKKSLAKCFFNSCSVKKNLLLNENKFDARSDFYSSKRVKYTEFPSETHTKR